MTDATKTDEKTPSTEPVPPTPEELQNLLISDLKKNIALIEKTVISKETRFIARVLRQLSSTRRRINAVALKHIISQTFPPGNEQGKRLLSYLEKAPVEKDVPTPMEITSTKTGPSKKDILPEIEVYLHLVVVIFLIDKKMHQEAVISSTALVERVQEFNRRTLNPLSSKAYFYYSYSYELVNRLEEIRGKLLSLHRTATLRHNDEGQVVLLNLLLRNYLEYNLYDQADKLLSKTTFPEESASSNQHARYLFYQGKIRSVQLDYTEAYRCLLGAIRKAPQNTAHGFRQIVHKLACIVQLLMGEIPERSIFREPDLKKPLEPYLRLTQTVRDGDLSEFHSVVKAHEDNFRRDKTLVLIQRLRHNVIKTGLRKINTSYSRISLKDICTKLSLESPEDAEFIVAKAIRDGVISASINHEGQYIQSKDTHDIYSTQEPQAAFHRRIVFCLDTHNEAVKAMRFPPNANKPSPETAKERREREEEIAKNLVEEEDDF